MNGWRPDAFNMTGCDGSDSLPLSSSFPKPIAQSSDGKTVARSQEQNTLQEPGQVPSNATVIKTETQPQPKRAQGVMITKFKVVSGDRILGQKGDIG